MCEILSSSDSSDATTKYYYFHVMLDIFFFMLHGRHAVYHSPLNNAHKSFNFVATEFLSEMFVFSLLFTYILTLHKQPNTLR